MAVNYRYFDTPIAAYGCLRRSHLARSLAHTLMHWSPVLDAAGNPFLGRHPSLHQKQHPLPAPRLTEHQCQPCPSTSTTAATAATDSAMPCHQASPSWDLSPTHHPGEQMAKEFSLFTYLLLITVRASKRGGMPPALRGTTAGAVVMGTEVAGVQRSVPVVTNSRACVLWRPLNRVAAGRLHGCKGVHAA